MIRKEEWVNILSAYKNGVSIREIARQTGFLEKYGESGLEKTRGS